MKLLQSRVIFAYELRDYRFKDIKNLGWNPHMKTLEIFCPFGLYLYLSFLALVWQVMGSLQYVTLNRNFVKATCLLVDTDKDRNGKTR